MTQIPLAQLHSSRNHTHASVWPPMEAKGNGPYMIEDDIGDYVFLDEGQLRQLNKFLTQHFAALNPLNNQE